MHRIRHRRSKALTFTVLALWPCLLSAAAVDGAQESLANTGLTGWPVPVSFRPPGAGVVQRVGDDGFTEVSQLMPDGSVFDLGSATTTLFWMGTEVEPVLVGIVGERNIEDLNGDGDRLDWLLATSVDGRPFLPIVGDPVTLGGVASANSCITRISAQLGVACLSEDGATEDLNSDGDVVDLELVLIRGDGSITRSGRFLDNDVGGNLDRRVTVLPDGSVSVGSLRVFPDGSVADIDPIVGNGEVVATVGTSRLIRIPLPAAQVTFSLVLASGAVIPLNASFHRQVGNTVWLQVGVNLCRVTPTGTTGCLGVGTGLDSQLSVLGDDWAAFPGFDSAGPILGLDVAYVVRPGQQAQLVSYIALRRSHQVNAFDLGAGRGMLVIAPAGGLLWIGPDEVTYLSVGAVVDRIVSLRDGRALVNLFERAGADYNGDGDITDSVTHLFANGRLTNLRVTAHLDLDTPDRKRVLVIDEGRGVLFAVDEATSGDRNSDGDATDLVAALFDGASVVNLAVAVVPDGQPEAVERFARLGTNRALVGVWEQGEGEDFDGDSAIDGVVTFAVSYVPAAPAPPFSPQVPDRLLDTRLDGPQVGYTGDRPIAGQTVEVTAPAGAGAVALNVTGLNASQNGFVMVYPCGEPLPTASNLNLTPGLITPNLVISKVGSSGKVCIFTQRSSDLIADLVGTFPIGSAYTPLSPTRVLDTRSDGPQVGYVGAKPVTGQTIEVPAPSGAAAVLMNVTGLEADQDGFVTVYPCGGTPPIVSNLNLTRGLITPNLVISKVGDNGKVCIFTQRSAHLIADLAGTFPVGSAYAPLSPTRVLDTRPDGPPVSSSGAKPANGEIVEIIAPEGAAAVVVSVTGLDAQQDGFVTVYPCGAAVPTASNLNLAPGRIASNLTITKVGANGRICIYTQRSAHLIADLAGTFPI